MIWELTDKDPIVNLRLFRHRNFSAGTAAMVVAYAAFFSVGILVPLWLQRNLGYTAIWAGFATAPIGILPVLLTPFVGLYANALRPAHGRQPGVRGDGADQLHARSYFNLDVDFRTIAEVQLFQGVGRGAVLHAGADDPAFRPGTARNRRRFRPRDVHAHARRQFRRVADHLGWTERGARSTTRT